MAQVVSYKVKNNISIVPNFNYSIREGDMAGAQWLTVTQQVRSESHQPVGRVIATDLRNAAQLRRTVNEPIQVRR